MANIAAVDAGVYARCSEDRNDGASVEQQDEIGLARCAAEGWRPLRYKDNDISASRYAKKARGDWSRLLEDLDAGLFGIVWLWESSRGDRKAYEWLGFLELCRDRGVRIYVETHERMYNPQVAREWKTLAEDGVANAYRSDESSLQIKRHLAAAAGKGRPHGPVIYGYIRRYHPETRKYITQVPHPGHAPVVAEIIARVARNEPVSAITRDLERRNIPAPGGGAKWSRQTVKEIAANPAYTGCPRIGGDYVQGWEPIVDMTAHQAAVAVLRGRNRKSPRPGRQRYLLSYLAICGGCDEKLDTWTGPAGRLQYRCPRLGCVHVDLEWLDELVTLAVCDAMTGPDAAELYRSDSREGARSRADAARLRAELDEWAEADITPRAYQIREAKLLPQIERAERAAAAAEVPLVLRELLTADSVRAGWDHLDIPARRAVIRALMGVKVARAENRKKAARTDPGRVIIEWVRG